MVKIAMGYSKDVTTLSTFHCFAEGDGHTMDRVKGSWRRRKRAHLRPPIKVLVTPLATSKGAVKASIPDCEQCQGPTRN